MDDTAQELNLQDIKETDVVLPVGLSERIEAFKIQAQLNSDDELVYYIYKFDTPTSNKRSLLDKTAIEPDEHELGCEYGSGLYEIFLVVKGTRQARSYKLTLHRRYDELMEQRKKDKNQLPATVGNGSPAADVMSQIAMMRTMIEAFKPIMNPNDPGTMAKAYGEMMRGMVDMQREMMQESMRGMVEMQNRLMSQIITPGEEGEENDDPADDGDEGNIVSLIQSFMPLVEEYLPKLLSGGPQSKVIAATIKSLPIFKSMLRDRSRLKQLIAYLEQTQGRENTEVVLMRLGLIKNKERGQVPPPVQVQTPRQSRSRARGLKQKQPAAEVQG